jgi:hypothetical protein
MDSDAPAPDSERPPLAVPGRGTEEGIPGVEVQVSDGALGGLAPLATDAGRAGGLGRPDALGALAHTFSPPVEPADTDAEPPAPDTAKPPEPDPGKAGRPLGTGKLWHVAPPPPDGGAGREGAW